MEMVTKGKEDKSVENKNKNDEEMEEKTNPDAKRGRKVRLAKSGNRRLKKSFEKLD